jgi:hypothetical protein
MTDLPPDRFETYLRRGFKWFLIMTGILVGLLVASQIHWWWSHPLEYAQ